MNAMIIFVLLLTGLFAMAYLTRRRFGVLGLALCAGALLSSSWAAALTPIVRQSGFSIVSPPLEAVVAIFLILLPSVVLLFGGPTYSKTSGRLIGSIAYTLLAFAFIVEPLGASLSFDGISATIFNVIKTYDNLVVIAGIALAVGDLLITRSPKGGKKGEH